MIVLSLFDGMSCGRIALQELGIPIEKYYASEVDKFAIQNTMANFPDTIQLGGRAQYRRPRTGSCRYANRRLTVPVF